MERCISEDRIKHMHSVAELMKSAASDFDCSLGNSEIYILGLLHDIGYLGGKEDHERYGSSILSKFLQGGSENVIAQCICWHGITPLDYMKMCQCDIDGIPNELILLWWADMMVESSGNEAGKVVGFTRRLNSIERRYGKDSKAYLICEETIMWLNNVIDRSLERKWMDI